MQTKVYLAFATCLLAVQISFAQNIDPKLEEAFQNTLDSMRMVLDINGLSAAVQLPDNNTWAGGSGVSTFSPIDSISTDHIFETGSSTKTITGMCILQLADSGVLSLDDSLHLWLPSFAHIDPNITIRQLLQHTSGIYDILQYPGFQSTLLQNPSQIWTAEEAINTFIDTPSFQPGTGWEYSNTNFILLGMIIEAATGNTYYNEIKGRFFVPLNLNSYINPAFEEIQEPIAHLWLDINGDGVQDDATNLITTWKSMFSIIGPAGGYFATPSDLAVWMKASMSGSMVSEQLWTEATNTINTSLPFNSKYGYGFTEQTHLGLTGYGHGGDLSYSTRALYFPEKEISIAICANDSDVNSWNLTSTLRALLNTYINCEQTLTSTFAINSNEEISLTTYPNPFAERINVKLKVGSPAKQILVQLYDSSGRLHITKNIDSPRIGINEFSINSLSGLPKGNYAILIEIDGKTIISKQVSN